MDNPQTVKIVNAIKRVWIYATQESRYLLEILFAAVIILGCVVLFRRHLVTKLTLTQDKDFFNALSSLATFLGVVIGAALSYIKFFKGRLLHPKLVLFAQSDFIPGPFHNLHWIEVEIKNTGNVAIWNYRIAITAILHGERDAISKVEDFVKWNDEPTRERTVDIAESAFEHGFLRVSKAYSAVTFQIFLIAPNGAMWNRALTKSNLTGSQG